MEGKQK